MGRKESSFHIGGEFNGYGSARYLKGIYPSMNPPVSQENVHLSPDFRQYLLKLLGTMPLVISPSAMNPILKAISGTLACVNEVIITQDKKSGKSLQCGGDCGKSGIFGFQQFSLLCHYHWG